MRCLEVSGAARLSGSQEVQQAKRAAGSEMLLQWLLTERRCLASVSAHVTLSLKCACHVPQYCSPVYRSD